MKHDKSQRWRKFCLTLALMLKNNYMYCKCYLDFFSLHIVETNCRNLSVQEVSLNYSNLLNYTILYPYMGKTRLRFILILFLYLY